MQRLIRYIDTLNETVGRAVSWLTTALVVIVCLDVLARYLLSRTAAWVMEVEWHLFSLIFLLGAGYALKHDRHVRVDLFFTSFSRRDRALVDLLGSLLFLLPWTALVLVAGWSYAVESYHDGEGSPNPGGLPYYYPIKFAIPLGLGLLLLQGLAQLLRSWLIYFDSSDAEMPDA